MEEAKSKGFPLIGAIFILLGVFKFIKGDNWVVWIILGALFGGLGIFSWKKKGSDKS
jgi:LPXTG-motif cell wall-anchored protein